MVKECLNNLTFLEIGKEIAHLWNFSQLIQECIVKVPPMPKNCYDTENMLKSLVVFSNHLVSLFCAGKIPKSLVANFDRILSIDLQGAVGLLERAVDAAADIFEVSRKGFETMKVQTLLKQARQLRK